MRLRTIKHIIQEILPELEVLAGKRNSSPPTYQMNNPEDLKNAILEIEDLGLMPDMLTELQNQSFYSFNGANLIIQQQEFNILNKNIPQLKAILEGTAESIEMAQNHEIDSSLIVSIKIPDIADFQELEKVSSKLTKIFSQTLLTDEIEGGFKIIGFDSGSNWIDILATSTAIVQTIGGLAWSGAVVFKKLQEGLLVQQKVREMKISNNAIEEVVEKSKEGVNEIAEKEAQFIYNKYFSGKDPEQIARIKMALKEIADLYNQGGTIKPSLEASEEVEEEFPNMSELPSIESKVKQIEAKKKK
ncbi:MAG TPA: hypothetical protein DCG42_14385 [Maribacter sp.]|uniref:hypothetical protein n=1 Tax=unclassified Maribacter TaxID=2615042 RepID=UPI000EC21A37|nr:MULTISPECIES: hypothetical protein [unclassified Maribacter]HAF78499.1 hypothetical protein [Maribacter sp.]HAI39940.1 hypothetical protein [Maribacter sp.]|tara:strand:+ start:7024 stop:7929 length:906 start_codon:yes stop_codon:yes gene_type:complete